MKREKSIKSISPMDSSRNGFDTLVHMDRAEADLNVPSPKGSFQRTQSFIKQILSMKADLNALFPTEQKDAIATPQKLISPSMASSASTSDMNYSSSRNYGMYRKKNSRSVKLAPLTPSEGSSFSSSTSSFCQQDLLLVSPSSCTSSFSSSDITPVSSIRFRNNVVGVAENHSHLQPTLSPADHARLWQDMLLQSPVKSNVSQKPVHGVNKILQFDEFSYSSSSINDNDELITDNCSVQAVQSDDDYHCLHSHQRQNKKYRTKPIQKSLSLDNNEQQYDDFTSHKAVLPQIYSCGSSDTVCMPYEGENRHFLQQDMQSWSQSTDIYDDFSYQTIRTKSFNGEGLVLNDEPPLNHKISVPPLASNNVSMKTLVSLHNDYDEDDLIPVDPDEIDEAHSNQVCEVERFLDAYCSGKEKQYASAVEALSSSQPHEGNFVDDLDEELEIPVMTKKSIKTRKSTGVPKKKMTLAVASFDDSDGNLDEGDNNSDGFIDNYYDNENDYAYHY